MPNREKSYLAYRIVKQNRLAINFVLLRSISCEAIADHAGTNTPTGPPTYRFSDLQVQRPYATGCQNPATIYLQLLARSIGA